MKKEYTVIVGATSLIAEHCARLWLSIEGGEMVLLGRQAEKLDALAADLRVRSPLSIIRTVILADFVDAKAISLMVEGLCVERTPDRVLIAHGQLPDQLHCERDLGVCRDAMMINGLSPVLFAEAFACAMQKTGKGTIGLIGSVAGDRGRRSNYVYGAAKGLVSRYAEGLQHRFAGTEIRIVMIRPGPTDTPMTADFKAKGMALAPAEEVAAVIVSGMAKGLRTVYAPHKWRYIMWVIRHLPFFIMARLAI